jgi:hypothetical protein
VLDQQEQQRPQHRPQPNTQQQLNFPSYSNRSASDSDMVNPIHQGGSRVVVGENEGGQWSIYGSLIRSGSSFEQHRYQYLQQQHQQGQSSQNQNNFSTFLPIATQPSIRTNQTLYPIHLDTARRSPHIVASIPFANNGPMSPSSNIPIPSRYINPQPFSHPQYTSSNFYRPNNIAAGHTQYVYHPSNASNDYESSSGPHQRAVNGQTQSYSETVERAEAGGWAHLLHTSVGGSTSSPWYDEQSGYRRRHNIGLKEVVRMACRFCETIICERGMKVKATFLIVASTKIVGLAT